MKIDTDYLIDTDIIIYWLKNKFQSINDKFMEIEEHRLFISSITVAELYYGAYNSSKVKENSQLVKELSSEINVVNFDSQAGKHFGKIKARVGWSEQTNSNIIDNHIEVVGLRSSVEPTRAARGNQKKKRGIC